MRIPRMLLPRLLLLCASWMLVHGTSAAQFPLPESGPTDPSEEPTPEEPAVSTADIVPRIVTAEHDLAVIKERVAAYVDLPPIGDLMLEQDGVLTQLQQYLKEHPVSSMTPGRFQEYRSSLLRFHSQLERWQELLQTRVTKLDNDGKTLQEMASLWHQTRADVNERATPNTLLHQIDALLRNISEAEGDILNRMGRLLELQSRVGKRIIQISLQLEAMHSEEIRVRDTLLGFHHPPLWNLSTSDRQRAAVRSEFFDILRIEASELSIYWQTSSGDVQRQIGFFVLLSIFLVVLHRRRAMRMALTDDTTPAMHLISKPIGAALLIVLLTTRWWQPHAPQSIRELSMLLTVFPVVYLLAGLIGRRLMMAVLGVQVLIVLNVLRSLALAGSPLDRVLLLLVGILLAIVLLLMLRAPRQDYDTMGIYPGRLSIILMRIGLALSIIAVGLNLFGNVNLAEILERGTFVGVLLAVWLPLGYLVLKAIFKFMLTSNLALAFRTVQSHGKLIYTRISFGLRALVIGLWIYFVVRSFSVEWIWSTTWSLLQWQFSVGSLTLQPIKIFLFLAMLWVAVLIARFVRFVLEQEILSRLSLERGIPTAISRLVHYALIGIGVFVASTAAGLSFSQFALITGALSVGIGFGLQNVVNNFVSGLILIVERPVDVGDTVEIGTLIGRVRTIGLRSSVVRTTTGAEVIVPNANFIANEVINWTLSDQHRRIEIPVGVAYGTDPHRVIEALMAAARDQEGVLTVPEPQVIFDGFGDSSLDFQLRFWTPQFQGWRRIRSNVTLAAHDEIKKAGIEIPFPQRDLHLRSIDDDTRQALALQTEAPQPSASQPESPPTASPKPGNPQPPSPPSSS